MSSMLKSDGCYHYGAPSGECYEVNAGMVSLQWNSCVIHTLALYKFSFLYLYLLYAE